MTSISRDSYKSPRVLSIQSHVVHGYVGNKCATFPLQVLGFEVDVINSVHFSNHKGYKHVGGTVMNETQLKDIIEALKSNNLLDKYTHILTGYVGDIEFLKYIGEIVITLKAMSPEIIYVCDAVLGDNGKLYVPENLIEVYRDVVIPLADIVTPNQFEAEVFTGIKLKQESDAWETLNWFHSKGVKTAILSSTDLGPPDKLFAYLSYKTTGEHVKYKLEIPVLGDGVSFGGTGDLFSALFLAHVSLTGDQGKALEKTAATIHAVIQNTIVGLPDFVERAVSCEERELKLIQSVSAIENPVVTFNANIV